MLFQHEARSNRLNRVDWTLQGHHSGLKPKPIEYIISTEKERRGVLAPPPAVHNHCTRPLQAPYMMHGEIYMDQRACRPLIPLAAWSVFSSRNSAQTHKLTRSICELVEPRPSQANISTIDRIRRQHCSTAACPVCMIMMSVHEADLIVGRKTSAIKIDVVS